MSGDAPSGSHAPQPGQALVRGGSTDWRDVIRFLPDVGQLLADVARDPRVARRAKLVAAAIGLYLLSPVDLIRDSVLQVGYVDDLALLMWGLRYLLRAAGYDLLHELWQGSEDGFVLLLLVAGVER